VTIFTQIMDVLLALASRCTSQKEDPARDIDCHFRIQQSCLSSDTSIALILWRRAGLCAMVLAAAERIGNWLEKASECKHTQKGECTFHKRSKGIYYQHTESRRSHCLPQLSLF